MTLSNPTSPLFGEITDDNSDRDSEEQETSSDDLSLVKRIVLVAAKSSGFFKHQQKDDPDLTLTQKKSIAKELLVQKPEVFLQRYGQFLSEEHLAYFDTGRSDNYQLDFYLRETRRGQCRYVREHKIRNRRYKAMQEMISSGHEHFSEGEMKRRNPLLHEQLVGKYQTEEEKAEADRPDMSNCSLTNIIIEHIDLNRERDLKKRLKGDEEEEEFDTDSEDEAEMDAEAGGSGPTESEKDLMRKEFVRAAYHSFLSGKDPGVDYSRIDADTSLDDLQMEDRDTEERYFEDEEEKYFDDENDE